MKVRIALLGVAVAASFLTTDAYAAAPGRWTGAMILSIKTMSSEAVSPDTPNAVLITLNEVPDSGFGAACGAGHNTEVVLNLAATNNSGSASIFSSLIMVRSTYTFITVYGTNTCNVMSGYETVDAVAL